MTDRRLNDRYVDLLLDRLGSTRYPSASMLDRTERAITSRQAAENYIGALLDHIEQDEYPSPPMLDRVNRLMQML